MKRAVIFSHDSYGLGHFRRCELVASRFVAGDPDRDCLIVTGSPRAGHFRLAERVDMVKLPSITKNHRGDYVSRKLRRSPSDIVDLRASVALAAIETYDPDVFLVDHAPTGAAGELVPVLDWVASRGDDAPRLVLGLRDIIDDAQQIDELWHRDGTWTQLDRYDDIIVYGDRPVCTTADELGLAERVRGQVHQVGYVAPTMPAGDPDPEDPYVLVTVGGGADGHHIIVSVLDALQRTGVDLAVRAVTGPLMSRSSHAELARRCAGRPNVELVEFTTELRSWIASARAVVSMAGYNTIVEVLAAAKPTLLIPRTEFRREQRLRAERMSNAVEFISWAMPEDLEPRDLELLLGTPTPTRASAPMARSNLNLDGAERAAELLARCPTLDPVGG